MGSILAIVTGVLFGAGVYCILRRSLMKMMMGIILIGQAANLLVFTASGVTKAKPVFALAKEGVPPAGSADPVPQALVLTAIVISFGLVVFSLALLTRAYRALQSDDLNQFSQSDQIS